MNRQERRAQAAQSAAERASEAGRVLQQQQQAKAQEPKQEPAKEPAKVAEKKDDRPPDWKPSPRNEPRRKAMEELETKDLERRGLAEPKEPEKVPDDPAPPTAEDMLQGSKFSEPNPEVPEVAPETPKTEPEKEPAKVETVRVKVDGEEYDAPKADVEASGGVASYQRDQAAERRLRKAAEALAEAQRVRAEITKMQEAATPRAPQVTDDQFIASKVDTIRFGTPEESAAALQEILQRTNKQIDPNQLENRVMERMRHDQAVEAFDKEFTDIVANPLLTKLALTLRNERIQQIMQTPNHGRVDWSNFYRTIGNEVRSLVPRPSQTQQAPKTDGTTSQPDKEARKASIVNLPSTSARAELPKEQKPETREDILNEARKRRGLLTG